MRTPAHLWIIGILSLLWNAGGAFDYVMTQFAVETYVAMLPEATRAFLDAAPIWFDAAWAFGVWGSILGSLLILARSAWASVAFLVSLAGLIVSSVWTYLLASPSMAAGMTAGQIAFTISIPVVLIALLLYTRALAANGHLR